MFVDRLVKNQWVPIPSDSTIFFCLLRIHKKPTPNLTISIIRCQNPKSYLTRSLNVFRDTFTVSLDWQEAQILPEDYFCHLE